MALSTWILTLESCWENSTSRCESWGLPLIKGGFANEAPFMARSSMISKPLYQQVPNHHILSALANHYTL